MIEQELIDLEHEWLRAVSRNETEKLESIVGHEYTLTANGFPGGGARLGRQEWMDTVPAYEVHSHEFRSIVVQAYDDAAVVLADFDLRATVRGEDRSGAFAVTDVWVKREGRWQVVARGSVFTPAAPAP